MSIEDIPPEQVASEVRSLIAEIVEISEEEIDDNAVFGEDLDVDSLLALEIVASIEKKYRIQIPEEQLSRVKTVNDTIALAREYLGDKVE